MVSEKADKRKLITDAAIRLFAKFGIKKTTIDEIATAAGVAKGTIYLYFNSKSDILLAVMVTIGDDLLAKLEKVVNEGETATQKLMNFALERVRFGEEMMSLLGVSAETHREFMTFCQLDTRMYDQHIIYQKKEREIFRSILEFGIDSGEFAIDDTDMVTNAMAATFNVLEEPWYFEQLDLEYSIEEKAKLMVELFINGIRKRD